MLRTAYRPTSNTFVRILLYFEVYRTCSFYASILLMLLEDSMRVPVTAAITHLMHMRNHDPFRVKDRVRS